MHNVAVNVKVAAKVWPGAPGILPYKHVPKDVLIKKGIKIKTIMIESPSNVLNTLAH